jgi:hypothetical protein
MEPSHSGTYTREMDKNKVNEMIPARDLKVLQDELEIVKQRRPASTSMCWRSARTGAGEER